VGLPLTVSSISFPSAKIAALFAGALSVDVLRRFWKRAAA
jgi:hypothetical protein